MQQEDQIGQLQENLIRICKDLLKDLKINVQFCHVRNHMDKCVPYEHLTLPQKLNKEINMMCQKGPPERVRLGDVHLRLVPHRKDEDY